MRLFLFPISNRRNLIYAQRVNRQLKSEPTYIEKITNKTAQKWVEWEAAESGWQKKVTEYGNKAFARIPYQEWGLKSIPPLSTRRQANELQGKEEVTVSFPPDVIKPGAVMGLLKQLATERQGLHQKAFYWSLAGLPVALPFGLVPIIPNLPFIYVAFRAWSHWRALNGAKHIEFLLNKNLLKVAPSPILQKVYDLGSLSEESMQELKIVQATDKSEMLKEKAVIGILDSTRAPLSAAIPRANSGPEMLLLPKGSGKLVSRSIGIPGLDVEIERALEQVEALIAKDKKAAKEKHGLNSAQTAEKDDSKK